MDTILLQIKNEKAYKLIENLEALNIVKVIQKAKNSKNRKAGLSAHDFTGIISKKDAQLIKNAIEEACEQIDPDDWK
jgi:predicted aldo/keto reductase-like oxidoreductase